MRCGVEASRLRHRNALLRGRSAVAAGAAYCLPASQIVCPCPCDTRCCRALVNQRRGSSIVRSQLRFVMHPDDDAAIMAELLRDAAVLLVDGPRWKTATPPTTRNVSAVGNYCIIWSPEDLPELAAEFIPTCNDWYCRAEYATIQFLRSKIIETVIHEGRLAISTGSCAQGNCSERRASIQVAAPYYPEDLSELRRPVAQSEGSGSTGWTVPVCKPQQA